MIYKDKKQAINIDKIEAQVERWDLFARIAPTVFLVVCIGLVVTGILDFEQAFWMGLALFAMTAVCWWFWTIYTIRHLVRTLNRASKNLAEVRQEFKTVSQDLEEYKNDVK